MSLGALCALSALFQWNFFFYSNHDGHADYDDFVTKPPANTLASKNVTPEHGRLLI